MEEFKKINDLVDYSARVLVGTILKRMEVLSEEGDFNPKLYRALVREQIYEGSRSLKKLIELQLSLEKVVFKTREK